MMGGMGDGGGVWGWGSFYPSYTVDRTLLSGSYMLILFILVVSSLKGTQLQKDLKKDELDIIEKQKQLKKAKQDYTTLQKQLKTQLKILQVSCALTNRCQDFPNYPVHFVLSVNIF